MFNLKNQNKKILYSIKTSKIKLSPNLMFFDDEKIIFNNVSTSYSFNLCYRIDQEDKAVLRASISVKKLIQNEETEVVWTLDDSSFINLVYYFEIPSSDDNNSTYNEIYLTFEKNGYIKSFDTAVSATKPEGICQVKVSYTDENDKEYSLTSSTYLNGQVTVDKEVNSVILYIKAYKFYPTSYSSLVFKGDVTSESFEELKGKQVNNEISINYVKIEE
jgi:hypothetical protein